MENKSLVTEQAPPQKNDNPAVWDMVIEDMRFNYTKAGVQEAHKLLAAGLAVKDMQDRDQEGARKYDTRLKPFNGRNALIDAYQEFLDGAVYIRQKIHEIEHDSTDSTLANALRALYGRHLDTLVDLRNIMHEYLDAK